MWLYPEDDGHRWDGLIDLSMINTHVPCTVAVHSVSLRNIPCWSGSFEYGGCPTPSIFAERSDFELITAGPWSLPQDLLHSYGEYPECFWPCGICKGLLKVSAFSFVFCSFQVLFLRGLLLSNPCYLKNAVTSRVPLIVGRRTTTRTPSVPEGRKSKDPLTIAPDSCIILVFIQNRLHHRKTIFFSSSQLPIFALGECPTWLEIFTVQVWS